MNKMHLFHVIFFFMGDEVFEFGWESRSVEFLYYSVCRIGQHFEMLRHSCPTSPPCSIFSLGVVSATLRPKAQTRSNI